MTTLTNAKAFKGILQYKSTDKFTKEVGYVYFIREFNEKNEETGNAEIYFGNRKYGDVNVSQLSEIESILERIDELAQEIEGKQNIIDDIDNIREGASLGSTALQSIPDEYVTENELNDAVNSKIFIGTQSEYETAYAAGKISVGALVIILGDDETNTSATTAMLGKAIIGTLLLGKA